MKTKHTPGKWATESKELNIITVHNGEINIADVLEIDIDSEEAEANARLIAAAPDLLDALIEAKKLLNSIRYRLPKSIKNSERFTFENTIANTIEIAINKATNP